LSVSSDVEARLDKKASRRPLGQARKKKETSASEPLRITSDQFNLEPGQALFRGSVLVKDADGNLSSDSIAVGMGEDDWEVQTIRAAGSVVLRAEQIQTTSEQADYDLSAGLIVLKGNPSWTMGERSGRADLLMIHRESQSVNAEGEVTMKLPADSVAEGGLLDFTAPGDGAAGGLPLEIRANVFLYQSATPDKTGFARYIGAVRLARGEGRLRCSFLNVRLAKGVGGVVESVNAAVGVRLMQGENQLTAQTATYDLPQDTVRFLGEPMWNWGTQSGRARLVELSPADAVFRASGRVRMQLPRPGGDGRFLVSSGAKTEPGGEPLLVVCDSFEYRQAAEAKGLDSATFNGNVVLTGDDGSRVQAQRVATGIDPGAAGLVSLDATGGLVATTTGANAMRYAGDRLVYTTSDETVHLTGRPSVEIRTRRDGAEVVALGQAAIYNLGTGWLRLSGDPVLKTAEGELRGREIVFSPQTKRLKATGRWKMTLNPNSVAKMRGQTELLDETKP
ncbi:MAG: LptA/OstA family protein, partial [Verrucomicrobiota bacterium]|nr:LptA/OstA family protein [Verrucomicrobiota bacterium]